MTSGTKLRVPREAFDDVAATNGAVVSMAEAERRHIIEALQATNGVVGGPKGAAALLGMKRSTLQSRMQKLGVSAKTSAP